MKALAGRIESAMPALRAANAEELLRSLRARLKAAYDGGVLVVPQHEIYRCVQLVEPPNLPSNSPSTKAIAGGIKDFQRRRESAQLVRSDGLWFHFTLAVEETRDKLVLLAYDFELVRPGKIPPFVRFDLNPLGHDNDSRFLRSHLHPGNEDVVLPAPILEPLEALELMLSLP